MGTDTRSIRSFTPSPLERRLPTEEELRLLYRHFPLGAIAAVDVVGPFFVAHLDHPSRPLREARIELLRHEFDASRCEHCRDLVLEGGVYLFTSARAGAQYVRVSSALGSEEYRHVA